MERSFLAGIGVGMAAGAAAVLMIAPPDKKKLMRSRMGKTIRTIGSVVDAISDAVT